MIGGSLDLQREVNRQRDHEHRVLESIRELEEEERRLEAELAQAQDQVTYYDSLAREMKRELRRPGLSTILRSLRR